MKTLRIEQTTKLAHLVYSGSVSDTDVKQALQNLADINREFILLIDLSNVEEFQVTVKAVRQLAASAKPGVVRQCAVIAPGNVAFGLSRMFQLLCDAVEFAVFREAAAAYQWLGIQPNPRPAAGV